ncbi:hypothetical protein PCASD_01766 [Puccinia coronata f. sp. avenae]|uniref:Poly A polymerase head domain-containing protein n=1 Tax=Puccinia coronata f. sp. avenae TaxID=200324 RepID=A0A2N5VJT2_9BASI|nr:hypothetical protein PCASD_01766 [Puccinia coronata f. sp. avenae]
MRLPFFFPGVRRPTTRLMKRTRYEHYPQSDKRPYRAPRMTIKNQEIPLNRAEASLCTLLDQCVTSPACRDIDSLTLRIAGGWVRDKLLGVQSNDLDIAISSLTGQDFATRFSAYLKAQQSSQQQQDRNHQNKVEKPFELGKIATIEARPDQSKHLETATTTFLGLDLDFVQLRSEEYGDQDSRIPSNVRFGTPLEDALRRDITINSLFYNVHTGLVEDHTGKGLADLEAGLIRTPLPAERTFKDDPLRLLRCIRFATRFGFQLDPDIVRAAQADPIKDAFDKKISRERVGTEVDKMLKGRDPFASLKMIEELGLYRLVFNPCANLPDAALDSSAAIRAAGWLDRLLLLHDPSDAQNDSDVLALSQSKNIRPLLLPRDPALRRRLFLACALIPYRPLKAHWGKKVIWAGEVVMMESLKLGNHDKNFIGHLFQALAVLNIAHLEPLVHTSSGGAAALRVQLGRLLRLTHVHDLKQAEGDASLNWRTSLLFAVVIELSRLQQPLPNQSPTEEQIKVVKLFDQLVEKILELDLPFVVTAEFEKRRLDGKEICRVLGIKPGKHLAPIIDAVIDHQIEFPDQTKDQGAQWLKDQFHSGAITTP